MKRHCKRKRAHYRVKWTFWPQQGEGFSAIAAKWKLIFFSISSSHKWTKIKDKQKLALLGQQDNKCWQELRYLCRRKVALLTTQDWGFLHLKKVVLETWKENTTLVSTRVWHHQHQLCYSNINNLPRKCRALWCTSSAPLHVHINCERRVRSSLASIPLILGCKFCSLAWIPLILGCKFWQNRSNQCYCLHYSF